jgi:uncharacterized protein (TIGR00255 family)
MFKSMTAYGRAIHTSSLGRFIAELHSVNRKHLEINTFLPAELLRFDAEIKRWTSAEIGRGQVNLKISASFDLSSPIRISPNLSLIRQYRKVWNEITKDLNIEFSNEAFLQILVDKKDLYFYEQEIEDEAHYRRVLQELVTQAATQLKIMKKREGEILYTDISARFARLPKLIQEISKKAPSATERYRERLINKISEIMGPSSENEERILREICIYAEKVDIAEELTRFDSHLIQVQELIHSDVEGLGKMLEFLVQELNREINTISSKSFDIDVSRCVIEIKSELERIREQIQNIE